MSIRTCPTLDTLHGYMAYERVCAKKAQPNQDGWLGFGINLARSAGTYTNESLLLLLQFVQPNARNHVNASICVQSGIIDARTVG